MDACIDAVRGALRELASGGGLQPLRPIMWLPEHIGALGLMPGYLRSIGVMGIKTVSVFPANAGTEHDSHQGTVMLFDDQNGALLAIIDATEITAVRTAAASAVATELLARPRASVLAILGSGVQARSHITAMAHVRPLEEVRIWSRNATNADRLARSARVEHPGLDVRVVGSPSEAVAGAHIVCTTTATTEAILPGGLLEPGMHINAVGSSVPFARELDGPAMARTSLFVDRKESTLNESGDFLLARDEGFIDEDHIVAEVGEILIGHHPGRRHDDEITLFESLGLAVEDVAAGWLVLENARAAGVGTAMAIGGLRHA
jgi:ornithine cyclodeaminase